MNPVKIVLSSLARRRSTIALAVAPVLVAAGLVVVVASSAGAATSPCGAGINPVVCENSQTKNVDGTALVDQDTWDIDRAGDDSIQGYATDMSVNAGSPINFKIDTTHAYRIDIYRMGYYGGNGARKWAANLSHATPVAQPSCLTDPSTQLVDCGNWSVSATWNVPAAAVSGVYFARLTQTDNNNDDSSMITFVVRNDASTSDIVFQTSDETWQAYNTYGDNDFYQGDQQLSSSQARAFKVSYNRPFATRDDNSGQNFVFSNEYPTIRLLERNGYDVSYLSSVDTDRYGASLLAHHKVFMSVGHDEYWSQQQRTNVENARDNGVNLMFLSGNEVYWHTRFEPSIDGSKTAYRTLVCYKETWDAAPTDPTGESTATWRDPRFGNAPGGANPENALTGTMYMANSDDLAVTVSKAEGKTRLWRGTSLSSMSASSTALAPHTVGYESDEDLDNGFRPAGLIDLSTTVGSTPQELQDFGLVVAPGTTTHHLTLYRAASGALVFGAGTIQWGWGLDADHDGNSDDTPADPRMQQATLNMLADMQALPTTLMPGLVMPAPSTDTLAPSVNITSPANNGTLANGTQVTVTGTATDAGGGVVAGVEVSADAGITWHPATGTASWTYTGILHGNGPTQAIRVRASDDSANLSTPVTLTSNVTCPCTLFGAVVPTQPDGGDTSAVELGVKVTPNTDGYISGVRFYKSAANTGTHYGTLWSSSGQQLATGTFTNETSSGWQTLHFATPVAVTAGTTYVASYWDPSGHYTASPSYFYYRSYRAAPLTAPNTLPNGSQTNGVFRTSRGFPTQSYNATNYYIDVEFSESSTVPPTVTAQSPLPNASGVATSVHPTVTFSKAMDSSTISFTLRDSGGNTVPASVSYDAASKTATLTPNAALGDGTLYAVTATGSDTNGNTLASPATWTFRTAYAGQTGGGCPCTLFPDTSVPSTVTSDDPSSVELGIRFTADTDGVVTGVRFYKGPQNSGTHVGSLWTAGGTQLATAVFTNESATGWQTVNFQSPVSVTAGTSYIASYRAPAGNYSATVGAYSSAGVDNFPLHAPTHGAVYTYGSGAPLSQSDADYGVDVVFTIPDSIVPTVTDSSPADGDTNMPRSKPITATFNTSLLTMPTVTVVPNDGGPAVAGTTTLNSVRNVLTFTPTSSLAAGKTYSITVTGARTLTGTPSPAPMTWSFTTGGGSCPCTLFSAAARPAVVDSGDTSPVSVGVKIVPSVDGSITGVRFYKAANNTGTHTGSVWDSAGNRLATVTFTAETASGWQQATFSSPVSVSAGATYTVSYFTPTGHYSDTSNYFADDYTNGFLTVPGGNDGVYVYGQDGRPTLTYGNTNYWVDAVFTTTAGSGSGSGGGVPADTTPPSISAVTAGAGATSATVTWTTDEPASSVVTYGTSPSALTSSASTAGLALSHSVALSGLNQGVTYYYRVTSADSAGNSATSPASSAQPASVTIADTTAPTITGVDTSAAGTQATVTWSTDEPASSVVDWGTSATSLGTRASTSGSTTSHTVTLTGLTQGTTYYYRVTSADSAGNSSTKPASSDAAASFTVADKTPPTITAVSGTPGTTTATVTWSTNEASSSRVDYGTSAGSLSSNATSAGSGTSHSVSLTGLSADTTYYFRVTSADAGGNTASSPDSTSAPATLHTVPASVGDSTSTDFAKGTNSSTYVTGNSDGQVVSQPGAAVEFTGSTVPTSMSTTVRSGGSVTVANGQATVQNADLTTTATYTYSHTLETAATLAPNQSIGFMTTSNASMTMSFSVNAAKQLLASVNDTLGNNATSVIATNWATARHTFRIEWTSSTATFYLDGVQKYTHNFLPRYTNLRPRFSDTVAGDAGLLVDWLRVGPYAASGTYTSRVFDATTAVTWGALTCDSTIPSGTGLTVQVRTGNTATPDAMWSAWTTVPNTGGSVGRKSRYVQYRLVFSSTGSRFVTATVRSLGIAASVG